MTSPENENRFFQSWNEFDAATEQNSNLIVIENYATWALCGNAYDPELPEKIRLAKGEDRGLRQAVGWTTFFTDRVLSTIDERAIEDARIRELVRRKEELTSLLGGIAFIRAKADMDAKELEGIPDCIIPPHTQTVQIYSVEGLPVTERVTRMVQQYGGEPIMTSANRTNYPEAITKDQAEKFRKSSDLPIKLYDLNSSTPEDSKPKGSYPVLEILPDRLKIIRPGWMDQEIMCRILSDYPVQKSTDQELRRTNQLPHYPEHMLRTRDLSMSEQKLQGTDLADSIRGRLRGNSA